MTRLATLALAAARRPWGPAWDLLSAAQKRGAVAEEALVVLAAQDESLSADALRALIADLQAAVWEVAP